MAVDLLDNIQSPDDVDALIATYLDAFDRGQAPTRTTWLAEHPAVAEDLRRFLDDLDCFAPRLAPGPAAFDTLTYTAARVQDDWLSADQFQPGRVFGDYELIEPIARGGMGVVFKARQIKLDRIVALKMILAGQLASAADIQRFRTEAQAAARLDHPGIVPVYEVGECQGLHYFTMAFVDGTSLSDRLRDGPLDPHQAARLVRELAAAIQFAHDNGVVHRDLKPGNVIIDKSGHPKLTDFGLAKRTDRASDATGTGQVLGTPSYMAPEQAGAGDAVGPAADIYGLGALLFALLTGRPPFQAATPLDTLLHVTSADPPRPTALNPAVPRDLETICLKCLEKAPGKRYADAAALGDDLGRFLTDRPILARPVGAIERAYRWCRRRPVFGAMTVALAVLLVAVPLLLAGLLAQEVTAREKVQAAEQARTRQLFDALVNEAAARRTSPRVGHGFSALDRIAAARDLADELKLPAEEYTRLRSEAVSALSLLDLKNATTGPGWLVRRDPELCRYVGSADCYLAWDNPGGLLVRRANDNQIVHRIPIEGDGPGKSQVWLSPDNRFVSSQLGGKLVVWQVDGDAPKERLRRDGVAMAQFAPDRPEITAFTQTDELIVQPLEGRGEAITVNLLKLTGEPRSPSYWKCQPGPRRQVAVPGTSSVRIVDMNTGRITAKFDVADGVEHIAWSPDGETVAVACGHIGTIVCFDLGGAPSRTYKGHNGGPEVLAFNPTGRFLLAVNIWKRRQSVLDMATGEAELRFHPTELDGDDVGPAPVPIRWQAAGESVHRAIPLLPEDGIGWDGECAIHPAGRVLATPTARGIVLNDLVTGRRLGLLTTAGECASPRFDTGGNLYAIAGHRAVRWSSTTEGNRIRFGPVEQLGLPAGHNLDISSDGRYVVQATLDGTAVLDRQSGKTTMLQPHMNARHVAISPDGSLAASFGWDSAGFRVWKTESDKLLEIGGKATHCAGAFFTLGGKNVITCQLYEPQLQLWSMPDCKLVRHLGPTGHFGVSPDGQYVAVAEANGMVRLTRISDGALIARFDAPGEQYIGQVTFSPDGQYLVGLNLNWTRQHVWDLWQLRRRLAEMKLDWETEPAPMPTEPREPLKVEVAAK